MYKGGEKMKTVKEVAEAFRVSKRTIFRWINDGKIEAVKMGRTVRISNEEYSKMMQLKENKGE